MHRAIRNPNLTAILALAALGDLVLLRLVSHVFLPSHVHRLAASILSTVGLFLSNLGGVLGVVLFAVVLLRAWHGNTIFPRPMRITTSTIGAFFVVLAGAGVLALPVSEYFVGYLRISHAFLALFLVVALWFRRCPYRLKVLVTLFAAPVMVHTTSMFFQRKGWPFLPMLFGSPMGQAGAFSGLLLSPFLIPRLVRGRRAILMFVGAIMGLALVALTMGRAYGLVQVVAMYGLRFELPPTTDLLGKVYVSTVAASYVSVTVAVLACLAAGQTTRLFGYGLILLTAAGHQIVTTNQTVFSICGLCALVIGAGHLQMVGDRNSARLSENASPQEILSSVSGERVAAN